MGADGANEEFGTMVRRWRTGAGLSQQDIALIAGCSARHLSFLENGRARPSRAMAIRIADALGAGMADRDRLLKLAGYAGNGAPPPELDPDRAALLLRYCDHVLHGVQPCPAALLDHRLRISRMNPMAAEVFGHAAALDETWDGGLYSFVLGALHPQGMRAVAEQWRPYGEALVQALVRDQMKSPAEFEVLLRRVYAFPDIDPAWRKPRARADAPQLVTLSILLHGMPVRLRIPTLVMSPPRSYPDEVYPELRLAIALPEDAASKAAMTTVWREIAGSPGPERLRPFIAPAPVL